MTDSYKKMSVNMYIMNPSYLSIKYVIIYINIHEFNFFYIFQFSKLDSKKYYTNVGLDNDDMLCYVVVV